MDNTVRSSLAQQEWEHIASVLDRAWFSSNRVTIARKGDTFICKSGWSFWSWLPDCLSYLRPGKHRAENRKTIKYLFNSFGQSRVTRLFRRWGVEIDHLQRHGLSISGHDIERLFVHLGHVTVEDLQDIYGDVMGAKNGYLHLSQKEVQILQEKFKKKEFRDLKKADIDELYKIAVPFAKIETMFLNNPPSGKPHTGHNRGINFYEARDVVYFTERFRRTNTKLPEGTTVYHVLKQFLGPLNAEGLVIPDLDGDSEARGYRFVWKKDCNGGLAQTIFLKTLCACGNPQFVGQIAFLSTQYASDIPHKWNSWLEDFRTCLGAGFIEQKYGELYSLITNPHKGFVDEHGTVDLIGYSLGGAQAQLFAVAALPTNRIRKLTVCCAPGVDQATAKWFASHVNSGKYAAPDIHIIYNHEDTVSNLGDYMLGYGAEGVNLTLQMLTPEGVEYQEVDTPFKKRLRRIHPVAAWFHNLRSLLLGPHIRDHIRFGCNVYTMKTRDARTFDRYISNKGLGHEAARKPFTYGSSDEFVKFLNQIHPNI